MKGIKVEETVFEENFQKIIKTLLYADDITLLLKDTEDLNMVLRIIDAFKNISGLSINRLKSEAMWLGSNMVNEDRGFELKWVREITILGIYFVGDKQASKISKNWSENIEKCKSH